MRQSTILTIVALYSFLNAAGGLAAPDAYSRPFGVIVEGSGLIYVRYFAVAVLGLGVALWASRGLEARNVRPALLGALIGYGSALLLGTWFTLTGELNSLGWILVLIDVAIVWMLVLGLQKD